MGDGGLAGQFQLACRSNLLPLVPDLNPLKIKGIETDGDSEPGKLGTGIVKSSFELETARCIRSSGLFP